MYAALKLLHVLAVIVFLGNITVGIFWKAFADQTKDPKIIAHTLEGIIQGDRILTIPAIFVLLIGGLGAAGVAHFSILGTGWILWGIIFFIIAGIAFGPVSRGQRQMRDVAEAGVRGGSMDWQRYEQLSKSWNVWGTIATIAPVIAVVLMVTKPVLPAL